MAAKMVTMLHNLTYLVILVTANVDTFVNNLVNKIFKKNKNSNSVLLCLVSKCILFTVAKGYFCTSTNIRITISVMAAKMAAKHLACVISCHHSATMKQ